jgi:hypothetical protein
MARLLRVVRCPLALTPGLSDDGNSDLGAVLVRCDVVTRCVELSLLEGERSRRVPHLVAGTLRLGFVRKPPP